MRAAHTRTPGDGCLALAGRSPLRIFLEKAACHISDTFPTNGLLQLKGGGEGGERSFFDPDNKVHLHEKMPLSMT